MPRPRAVLVCALLAIVSILVFPLMGPEALNWDALRAGDPAEWNIFLGLRVSRSLVACLAGGSLAIAGAVFQALLRNSLATPYTLGVSSGAALGAVIAICLRFNSVAIASLGGALVVLILVLRLSSRSTQLSSHALVLAGVSITSVCSGFITILHSFAGFSQSFAITSWLIGSVEAISFTSLGWYAAAVLPVWGLLTYWSPAWNLMSFGEAWAESRGVDVRRMSLAGYLAGSWLAALTVSFTGPIGFVGLLIPHFIREAAGADHRVVVPAAALLGAAFLCACDALGRTILSPADVPAGVITAIIGGPGLVWILHRERAQG